VSIVILLILSVFLKLEDISLKLLDFLIIYEKLLNRNYDSGWRMAVDNREADV
jgi:hypothetical protein